MSGTRKRQGAGWLRRLLPFVVVPAVLGPLGIFVFVLVTETAHDEEDCPPQRVQWRELAPGVAIEELSRNCLSDVHERRFVLHRAGKTQLLGRRRFEASAFEGSEYGWDAGIRESGEVHMYVTTPGYGGVAFREGTPDETGRSLRPPGARDQAPDAGVGQR